MYVYQKKVLCQEAEMAVVPGCEGHYEQPHTCFVKVIMIFIRVRMMFSGDNAMMMVFLQGGQRK